MLRRLLLIACLLAPLGALAQTAGNIAFTPGDTFGASACVAGNSQISMTWTIAFVSGTVAVPSGATYRILASNQADCPTTDTTSGAVTGLMVDSLTANGITQTYPGTGDALLYVADLASKAGLTCTGTDTVIHVCVRLIPSGGGTALGNAQSVISLQLAAPPVPVMVSVSPGDSALYAAWADGTANGTTASTYNVSVLAQDPALDSVTHTGSTSNKNLKVSGLKNGVTYDVKVQAVSSGGNTSAFSTTLSGTPQPTTDFWETYQSANGPEQGGCAGGAGGLLSLVVLAGLGRVFRRRS